MRNRTGPEPVGRGSGDAAVRISAGDSCAHGEWCHAWRKRSRRSVTVCPSSAWKLHELVPSVLSWTVPPGRPLKTRRTSIV
jgi:hypothetical protein